MINGKLIVDNFAGGGGASTGIEMATGVSVDIAINHDKEAIRMQVVARTFLGPVPPGCVPYHINGCQEDNYVNNIGYITRRELGKRTGAKSRRKPVAKIGKDGEVVEVYPSARAAARENFMSYQTVTDRCNGKRKSAFAPDGYAYAWEDSEHSMGQAMGKIKEEKQSERRKQNESKTNFI